MNWERILQLLPLVVLVLQGLGLWAMWSLSRKFVPRAECEACRKEMGNTVAELATEARVAQALSEESPSGADLANLEKTVEAVRGDVKKLGADIRGQAELLQRVERQTHLLIEHHLKGGRDQ